MRVLSAQYLQGCINFELNIGGKICNFISLYRSLKQTQDKFEKLNENLELNLESSCQNNPQLTVLIEDSIARSKNWYRDDKFSDEGSAFENVTAQFGLQQIITEPYTYSSSCIDLVFMSKSSLITASGLHSSLHPNCHYQIVFTKLNFHIIQASQPLPYSYKFLFFSKIPIFSYVLINSPYISYIFMKNLEIALDKTLNAPV